MNALFCTLALILVPAAVPEGDPALDPPKVIVDAGPEYADEARIWQGIPGIERAENGRLWATWYSGGPTEGIWNYVLLYTSDDDGQSWTQKRIVHPDGIVRAFDPALWIDPLGRLWLFWSQGYGGDKNPTAVSNIWDGRAGVWAMVTESPGEEDPEWSAPRRLCNGVLMNKPTVTSTGSWLLPAALWRVAPNPDHAFHLTEEAGANVVGSRDNGGTWTRYGGARMSNPAFDEHMVVERGDGSLWMLLRTGRGIGQAVSKDGGQTWGETDPAAFSPLPSARFFLRRLASGKLLFVRHNPPDGKTRSHLTAFLSGDDGATWEGGLMVDERSGVSYPDGVETKDGRIYLIYDYSRYKERDILMAVFTEEDIMAGSFTSDAARERVLINKATGELP